LPELNIKLKLTPDIDVKKLNVILLAIKSSLGDMGRDIKLLDVNKLQAEFSKIDDEVRKTNTELGNMPKVVDNLVKKGDKLRSAFAFNQISTAVNTLTSSLSVFSGPYIEFDKQVRNIGSILVGSGRDFNEFYGLIGELSKESTDSSAALAEAAYQAVSAGIGKTNEEVMKFVKVASQDALTGLADTTTAVDYYSSALNAYGVGVEKINLFSNATFSAIKLGKTTFEELAATTSTWLPMAAATKVSFEEMSSAIAAMTTMGTPTAQAATQIRAALVLIQKGAPGLNKALKDQGRSLEEFQVMLKKSPAAGGGLINTLEEIRKVAAKAGQTLPEATGRIEAANAILQLTGDNFARTKDFYSGVLADIENNVAAQAFEVASQGIANQSSLIMKKISGIFQSGFKLLGQSGTVALSVLEKMGPTMVGLGGLGQILPTNTIKNFASSLATKLAPALGATSTSFGALSKALLTNPFFLAIAGAITLIGVLKTLNQSSADAAKTQLEDAKAAEDLKQKQIDLTAAKIKLAQSNTTLVDEFEKLGASEEKTGQHSDRYWSILNKLTQQYPDAVDASKGYAEVANDVRDAMGKVSSEAEKQDSLQAKLIREYEELGSKSKLTADEQNRFKEVQGQLKSIYPDVIGSTKDFRSELDLLKNSAFNTTNQIFNLREQYLKYSGELQKNIETRIAAEVIDARETFFQTAAEGFSINLLNDKFLSGAATSIVNFFKSAFDGETVSVDAAKKFYKKYIDEITNAKNINELELAYNKILGALSLEGTIGKLIGPTQAKNLSEKVDAIKQVIEKKLGTIKGEIKVTTPTGLDEETIEEPPPEDEIKKAKDKQERINKLKQDAADKLKASLLDLLESQIEDEFLLQKTQIERSLTEKLTALNREKEAITKNEDLTQKEKQAIIENINEQIENQKSLSAAKLLEVDEKYLTKAEQEYDKSEQKRTKNLEKEQKKREELLAKQVEFIKNLQPALDTVIDEMIASMVKFTVDAEGNITDLGITFENLSQVFEENAAQIATSFGASIGQVIADTKGGTKEFVLAALKGLRALVPILLVEILGKELASKSLVGFLTFAGLAAALYTALAVAESGVQSLATGAKFEGPTMTVVGDASRVIPGKNAEWLVRDPDIRLLVSQVIGDVLGLMSNLVPEEYRFETPIKHLINSIGTLIESIDELHPLFEGTEFKYENIIDFAKNYSENEKLKKVYFAGGITPEEFNQKNLHYEIKLKSYAGGSGFINEPELALIGDSVYNPEIVLNTNMFRDILANAIEIADSSKMSKSPVNIIKSETSIKTSNEILGALQSVEDAVRNIKIIVGDETIYNANNRAARRAEQRNRT